MESAYAVRDILKERDNVAVLVEDVFGKFEISKNAVRDWMSVSRAVSHTVGPQCDIRQSCLVINARKNIYDECSITVERSPLLWKENTIDLDNILLSDDEKRRMIKIYVATVTDVDVDRILNITTPVIGFPQCCVVLSECLRTIGNNKTLDIFLKSIYPLKDELRRLQDELPLKFISLALVFIQSESIKNQCSTTNPICKFLIKRYSSLDDIADITDEDIENALYSCSPFYIFLKDDVFQFSHNSIQDSVASCLWEDAQKFVIENCHVTFLKRISVSDSSEFEIKPSFRTILISRFEKEINLRSSFDTLSEAESLQDETFFRELFTDTKLLDVRDINNESFARHLIHRNQCAFIAEYFVSILDKLDPTALLSAACEFSHKGLFHLLNARHVKVDIDVLFSAIKGGNLSVIKKVCSTTQFKVNLDKMMQSKQKEDKRTNLLQEMCLSGNLEALKLFPLKMTHNNMNDSELLYYSTLSRSLEMVKFCVENGADVRQKCGEYRSSPLHTACSEGHLEIVNYLLKTSKDLLEIRDNEDYTPLFHAVIGGHIPVVDFLVKSGADAQATGKNGRTILHLACWKGHFDMSMYIIEHFPRLLSIANMYRLTVAHYAAIGGSIRLLEKLLEIGIEVKSVENTNRSVIHSACQEKNNFEMVAFLTNKYPYLIQPIRKYGWTALHDSVFGGSVSVVEHLIGQGLDVYQRTKDGANILHLACENTPIESRLSFVQYLVQNFSGLSKDIDKEGRTVIHYAARGGSLPVIKYIEKNDAKNTYPDLYHQTNIYDWTALHDSVFGGSMPVVEHLIGQGLDVYQRTKDGANILHLACENTPIESRLSFVQYVVQNFPGLSKDIDKEGRTVIHYAARGGSLHVIKYIEKNDKKNTYPDLFHQTNIYGWTALHDSVFGGSMSVVEHLIGQGLDVYQRTENGTNILHLACETTPSESRLSFVQYLVQNFPGLSKDIDKKGRTIMHYAALGGSLPVIKYIEKNDAKNTYPDLYHQTDIYGWTALHDSVFGGSMSVVEHLIGQGLDVYQRTKDGANILHLACENTPIESRLSFVQYVVQNFPGLSKDIDKEGRTVIHFAARGGSLHVIKYIEKNDKKNTYPNLYHQTNIYGWTALHDSVFGGSMSVVGHLIGQGLDVYRRTKDGANILHLACENTPIESRLSFVQYLVQNFPGLSKDIDKEGRTVIHYAARGGSLPVIKYIEKNDAKNTYPDLYHQTNIYGWTALHDSVFGGSMSVVEHLIGQGLDVYQQTEGHATILHLACQNNPLESRLSFVQYLVQNFPGLSKDIDKEGRTVIHYAARGGSLPVIKYIEKNDTTNTYPDLYHQTNIYGWTALHDSVFGGSMSVVEHLIGQGLDVYQRTENGTNILHLACENTPIESRLSFVQYVVQNFPELSKDIDKEGRTVIHYAARGGSLPVIKYIEKNDTTNTYPDLYHQTNIYGWTALHDSVFGGSMSVVGHLIGQGLDVYRRTKDGANILHLACENTPIESRLSFVQYLVQNFRGLSKDIDKKGRTVMHYAAIGGSLPVIKYIEKNDTTNTYPGLYHQTNIYGWTALHDSVFGGSMSVVEHLIDQGLDVYQRTEGHGTILHLACENTPIESRLSFVQYLVQNFPGLSKDIDEKGRTILHYAARGGSLPVIKYIEKNDTTNTYPDLYHQTNIYGWTALHDSVFGGSMSVVEHLIGQGLDVYQRTENGTNILHLACQNTPSESRLSFVQYVVQNFPELSKDIDKEDRTVMHYAARGGSLPVIKYIEKNDTKNTYPDLYHQTNIYGWTALHDSVFGGSMSVVGHLIGQGLDVYQRTKDGANILHLACENNPIESRLSFVQYLVQNFPGLSKDIDEKGRTILHYAARGGSLPVIKYIEKNDSKNTYPDLYHQTNIYGWTALHDSVFGGSVYVVEHLIGQGLDVYQRTENGTNILHLACQNTPSESRLSFVQYLVQNFPGLSKDIDEKGRTILHYAARGGSLPVIKYMEKNDSKNTYPDLYHQTNIYGWTALHDSVLRGSMSVVEHLICQGLDVYQRTENGTNILHLACETTPLESRLSFVQYLVQNFPELSKYIDKEGRTVMHYAALGGSLPVIKYIEKNDTTNTYPDLYHQTNIYGWTALHDSVFGGSMSVVGHLIGQGLDVYQRTKDGANILHLACETFSLESRLSFVQYLAQNFPGLSKDIDKEGRTVMHYAARGGSLPVIKFIEKNDTTNTYPDLYHQTNIYGWTALHDSVFGGSVSVVEYLVGQGLDVYQRTEGGANILHLSCENTPMESRLSFVQYLLQNFPELSKVIDKKDKTVMHYAAMGGSLPVIKLLEEKDFSIEDKDKEEFNSLNLACLYCTDANYMEAIKYMMNKMSDFQDIESAAGLRVVHCVAEGGYVPLMEYLEVMKVDMSVRDGFGCTVLCRACLNGKEAMAIYLSQKYPDQIEIKDFESVSILHAAARSYNLELLKYLITIHPDMYVKDNYGISFLDRALYAPNVDIPESKKLTMAKYLVEEYPALLSKHSLICAAVGGSITVLEYLINVPSLDINTKDNDKRNILQEVCWAGRAEGIINMVDYLATRYPKFINLQGEFNMSTLHYAAMGGNVTVFKYLLEKGLNVYDVDDRGWTVLHYAAGKYDNREADKENIVKYLLDNYPDLIEKSKGTVRSVIHCAADGGSVRVFQLLSNHFDIFDKTHDGSTVLHIAAGKLHLSLVCHLADKYPSLINELDDEGMTTLMGAADNHPYKVVTDIVRYLVDRGCDVEHVSIFGDTVMSIALRRNNERLVAFLEEHIKDCS